MKRTYSYIWLVAFGVVMGFILSTAFESFMGKRMMQYQADVFSVFHTVDRSLDYHAVVESYRKGDVTKTYMIERTVNFVSYLKSQEGTELVQVSLNRGQKKIEHLSPEEYSSYIRTDYVAALKAWKEAVENQVQLP